MYIYFPVLLGLPIVTANLSQVQQSSTGLSTSEKLGLPHKTKPLHFRSSPKSNKHQDIPLIFLGPDTPVQAEIPPVVLALDSNP